MINYRQQIAQLLAATITEVSVERLYDALETPPSIDMGDYAFPCFLLAKAMRKSPMQIASTLAESLSADWLARVEAKGAYLNFFLDGADFAKEVVGAVLTSGDRYGASDIGKGKTVCLDFSSTNIAKPFHIGHIRSTVQGDAMATILEFLGYNTVRINYLGDYGTQFGMLINAYELWGDEAALEADPIHELLRLYVKYNSEAKEKSELMDQARDRFYKLENGSEAEMALWTRFKELSLREFRRVYDMLNIRFDSWDGEFYHAQFIDDVLKELEEKALMVKDNGAMIIPLGDEMPPALILKSNGSSTYITRDIATALYRKRTYDFSESLYVVGTQQNLHFRQLKAVMKRMGYDWSDHMIHVQFGMISLAEGTMSTRSGNVVFLEDVLNNAIDKTKAIIEARNPQLENKALVARQVGIGAIKFQELYNNRIKDYTFNWDDILNFDGETGPYVQYTIARANRVVVRAAEELGFTPTIDVAYDASVNGQEERALLHAIYDLPQAILNACDKQEPSMVTRQTMEIAKAFNKFYNRSSVLNAEDASTAQQRLNLVAAAAQSLKIGLGLLGIEAPEQM